MDPSGYYDSSPTRIPRSPITLAGFHGTRYEHVARLVAAFTSLPLLHVTELVVHDCGKSARRVLEEDGSDAHAAAITRSVDRALRSTPFGIVILEARCLAVAGVAPRVLSDSVLVALHYADEPAHDDELAYTLERAVVRVSGERPDHTVANEIVDALSLRDERLR